jgi:hypothetical protein
MMLEHSEATHTLQKRPPVNVARFERARSPFGRLEMRLEIRQVASLVEI